MAVLVVLRRADPRCGEFTERSRPRGSALAFVADSRKRPGELRQETEDKVKNKNKKNKKVSKPGPVSTLRYKDN